MKNIEKASGCFQKSRQYREVLDEIDVLNSSETVYDVEVKDVYSTTSMDISGTTYNTQLDRIEIRLNGKSNYMLAHELKHAFQFDTGKISFRGHGGEPYYDMYDEKEAYNRGMLFGGPRFSNKHYMYLRSGSYWAVDYLPDEYYQELSNSTKGIFKINGKLFKPNL